MKRYLLIILVLMSTVIGTSAQTAGNLTVTTTTSNAGGIYAPRNIIAVWIEDEQGHWIKTLLAYAAGRITHLNTWEASTSTAGSTFNVVDAITGATKSTHAVRTCTWNGTDVNGDIVPDGTYTVRMELTDKNGTGNFSSFTFNKGINTVNLSPANVPSFSSISIIWEPSTISVSAPDLDKFSIFPNPTDGKLSIKGENIKQVRIWNSCGKLVHQSSSLNLDLANHPDGIYFISISTGSKMITRKIILQK